MRLSSSRRGGAGSVGFVVGNGISANRYRMADLEATTRALGYRPATTRGQ